MRFHHIGVAVKDSEQISNFISNTFYVSSSIGPVYDSNLNAELTLFNIDSGSSIELVSGLVVQSFLNRQIALYHACYEVDDIFHSINLFKYSGAKVVVPPTPAILFDNRLVAFLHTPIGLIELLSTN